MRRAGGRIVFEAIPDDKGGLRPANAPTVRARLAKWNGDRVLVTVSRGTVPKTNPQLGYYFGVVVPNVAEFTGYTEEEAHHELKLAWGPVRESVAGLTGEAKSEQLSLSEATKDEMSKFLDRVLMEMAHMGLHIPGPNDDSDDPI